MPIALNLTNKKPFRMTALRSYSSHTKRGRIWICKCDCGNTSHVSADAFFKTKSCGCLRLEKIIKPYNVNSSEYRAWAAMKSRTKNPNNKSFHVYGARGIRICNRWFKSFENFYKDMGKKPTTNHSIDRIDNGGDYTPENCRWATKKQQSNNTRTNVLVTFNHKTMTIAEWARELNIKYITLQRRLKNLNWPIEKALTTPVRKWIRSW